ncbi:MAG TPA: YicC/YloC family endoribonuclease [Candidatus Babeliales bacterium]|nr:YicC/YloC family endoribonuclease [Candidatus Babeliales bacterium]
MIRSMTGFSSRVFPLVVADNNKTTLSISIKSLNSRYFEVSCKLPYQLNNLETDITKLLKSHLLRGHIYITIYASNQAFFKAAVEPSLPIIKDYLKAIEQIKQNYPISGDLSLSDLLQLPNVFATEEQSIDETTKQTIMSNITELIQELIAAEEKEGMALKKDVESRISIMEQELARIEITSGELMKTQKEKVQTAVQQTIENESMQADIQKQAAYALLDKMDINEEIVRFKTHLKNFITQLTSSQIEVGKRLDFTLQEMGREINTIAAKCSDATIASHAINIKVELEKSREQIQNIV